MDPTNNPMQNLNSVPGANAVPGAGVGMDNSGMGAGMDGGMPMGGASMNEMMGGVSASGASAGGLSMPMSDGGASAMGSAPTGGAPMGGNMTMNNIPTGGAVGGTVAQPVGGQMSPGQMFQAGGVAAPMGALGAIPGDYSSANSPLLGATDPITMPAPPKAPDPVEVELNAPFKAAGPVPGSIGSAVSMPGDPNQVTNVAFNDPAMMAPNSSMMPNKKSLMSRLGMDGGKKMDKKTLIILGSIVGVIVLAVVFVVVTAL